MSQHDITYRYARKAGVGDALGTADELEEYQRRQIAGAARLSFRRETHEAPRSPITVVPASSLVLGPDGKPLTR